MSRRRLAADASVVRLVGGNSAPDPSRPREDLRKKGVDPFKESASDWILSGKSTRMIAQGVAGDLGD
jgi:hypothetical protein